MRFSKLDTGELRGLLLGDAWFSACDVQLQDALLAHARLRTLDSGECLYHEGDAPAHALFCVLEGAICVGSTDADGASSMLVYLEPLHWFGEACLIDGLARQQDAYADGPTRVLAVELASFQQWLDQHPRHWQHIARLNVSKLRITYQVIAERGSLQRRLARRLWLMAHGFGARAHSPSVELNVSQEQLAHMMGSSRQSVNAAIHHLEEAGLIRQRYRGLHILSLPALLKRANQRCDH